MDNCKDPEIHKESGMYFCPLFNNSDITTFPIEKSGFYTKPTNRKSFKGVKVVEFLSLKDDNLYFIEAKESTPKVSVNGAPRVFLKNMMIYKNKKMMKKGLASNFEEYFQNWSSNDFEEWTKWKFKFDKMETTFQELYDKMHHSLDLISSNYLSVHSNEEIPTIFQSFLAKQKIIFLLVVNTEKLSYKSNGKEIFYSDWSKEKKVDWRGGLSEKLNQKFLPLKSIWDMKIEIYTDEEARRYKIIS